MNSGTFSIYSKAVIPFFLLTMFKIFGNDTLRIEKSELSLVK